MSSALGTALAVILLTALLPTAAQLRGGEVGPAAGRLLLWHGEVALALAAVWVLGSSRCGPGRPATAPTAALAAFGAWTLAVAALSPYAYAGCLALLEIGAFAAVWYLSALRGGPPGSGLAGILLAAGVLESVVALGQRLAGEGRPGGTLENPNHLGGWLVAVAALNVARIATPGASRAERALRGAGCLACLGGMLLTGSRGAVVALVAASLALLPGVAGRLGRRARIAIAAAALVVLAGVGLRLGQRLAEADPFRYQRVRIWRASGHAVLDRPWTGTGPLQFRPAAERYHFPDGDGPLRFDRGFFRTHSDLLRVPAELGAPGLLLVLVFLGAGLRGLRGRRDAAGAVAAVLALAAQGVVDNVSEEPAIYLLAAVLLGSLVSRPRREPAARVGPALRAVGAIGLVLGFTVGDVGPYVAWRLTTSLPAGKLDRDQQQRLDRALALNPLHPDAWMRRALLLSAEGSDWDPAVYAAAREAAERAIRLQPGDARYRAALAFVEARACRTLFREVGSRRRAAARFRDAERLAPHNPRFPLERAKFLLDTGDPDGARRAAERALAIEPNAVAPRLVLADALVEAGRPGAAARAGELLAEARELAERFDLGRDRGDYARAMLELDPLAFARVARKIGP